MSYQRPSERFTVMSSHLPQTTGRSEKFRGRIRTYPGVILFLLIIAGAAGLIVYGGLQARRDRDQAADRYNDYIFHKRKIRDGGVNEDGDIISEDGQIGNPLKYPDMGCELPNYMSKGGKIVAVSKNGTSVTLGIKGTNWFGMETSLRIPYGLWENSENGTSAYEIASFLSRNKFNSVRLPLSIANILTNSPPEKDLINMATNRAINLKSYVSMIQSIVTVLGYRRISVLLSLHTLTPQASGGAWYSERLGVSEEDYLKAVDRLTSSLCSSKYWNIVGVDLKNEPYESSWGGEDPDWHRGATLIGNRVLSDCKNWLAFVEGINGQHTITLQGKTDTYYDWWGGGLQNAKRLPVQLDVNNKVVYAPHYYTTAVNPAWYFYAGGTFGPSGVYADYVELDNATLYRNVADTMYDMFGFLVDETENAVLLGEFGGLYEKDAHPRKTTQRTIDATIREIMEKGYCGGYMWSLNPESAYQFNPADTSGKFTEGLLEDDWLTPNKVFIRALEALDDLKDLKRFPCFQEEITAKSTDE